MSHSCTGPPLFQSSQKIVVGQTPVAVVAGDFDGDGRPDLAVANSGSNDVSILLDNRARALSESSLSHFALDQPLQQQVFKRDIGGDHRVSDARTPAE